MEEKNKLIKDYIKQISEKINNEYGEIITIDKINRAYEMFKNSPKSYEEIIGEINQLVSQIINQMHEQEREYPQTQYYGNYKEDERESRTFSEIVAVQSKIQQLLDKEGLKIYISGGTVPYILLNEDSHRLHDDIDSICDMKDIQNLRELFQRYGLYIPEWDSLNYSQDGIDYGFEVKVDGVPVGIYPFTYIDGKLTQYTWDPYNKLCKIKELPLQQLSDLVTEYTSADGKIYNTMTLEYIKKTKDNAGRPKDIKDVNAINRIGYRQDIYDRISMYTEIQSKQFATFQEKKTTQSEEEPFFGWKSQEEKQAVQERIQHNQATSNVLSQKNQPTMTESKEKKLTKVLKKPDNKGTINIMIIPIIICIIAFALLALTYFIIN